MCRQSGAAAGGGEVAVSGHGHYACFSIDADRALSSSCNIHSGCAPATNEHVVSGLQGDIARSAPHVTVDNEVAACASRLNEDTAAAVCDDCATISIACTRAVIQGHTTVRKQHNIAVACHGDQIGQSGPGYGASSQACATHTINHHISNRIHRDSTAFGDEDTTVAGASCEGHDFGFDVVRA